MKTFIVSNTASGYEEIHTEQARCLFLLKLRYLLKGYKPWAFPGIRIASIVFKLSGKRVLGWRNVTFTRLVPGTDQVTYWSPYMNVM